MTDVKPFLEEMRAGFVANGECVCETKTIEKGKNYIIIANSESLFGVIDDKRMQCPTMNVIIYNCY